MEVDIDCASKYEGGMICSGVGKSISVSGSMVSSDDGISGTLSGLTSMYKEKSQKIRKLATRCYSMPMALFCL